jgi:DNA repair photolyase
MVGTAPENLSELLRAKFPASEVHTLVVWTKDPITLLTHRELRETVSGYGQLFIHCTITGMGKTRLEPRSPSTEEALSSLSELVEFVGLPERIRVRFDPLVHLVLPSGHRYSNVSHFGQVARVASALGIPSVTVSWMECYPKVLRRLAGQGIGVETASQELIEKETECMRRECAELGLSLLGCCVPGLESSRCIDGRLLSRLHPEGLKCSEAKAKGQRALCTCTASLDIGWYSPCVHGCLYCYANPDANASAEGNPWPGDDGRTQSR